MYIRLFTVYVKKCQRNSLQYYIKIEIITILRNLGPVSLICIFLSLMINYINCYYSSLKVIHDMDFVGGGLLLGGGGRVIYISTSFWSLKYLLISNKYDIKPRHLSEDYFRERWCDFENGCKIVSLFFCS